MKNIIEGAISGDPGPFANLDYTAPDEENLDPDVFTQNELKDLVSNLTLSKEKVEVFASKLK